MMTFGSGRAAVFVPKHLTRVICVFFFLDSKKYTKANGVDESLKESPLRNGNGIISSGSSIRTEDEEEDEFFLDTIEVSSIIEIPFACSF